MKVNGQLLARRLKFYVGRKRKTVTAATENILKLVVTCELWLQNVVKLGKCRPGKLVILSLI